MLHINRVITEVTDVRPPGGLKCLAGTLGSDMATRVVLKTFGGEPHLR